VSILTTVQERLSSVVREVVKFGIVGGLAFVVDFGLFNVLRHGVLEQKPLTAKVISVVVATLVAYLGNRHWAFRHRGSQGARRETTIFFALNGAALLLALGCLGFSHYVLGLQSALADNLSGNVLGMALGTAFRFWSYRKFVFVDAPVVPQPVRVPVRTLEPAGATALRTRREAVPAGAEAQTTAA
jgi:putative flippase GtrA